VQLLFLTSSKSYESHACISVSYFGFGRKRNKEKELRAEKKKH